MLLRALTIKNSKLKAKKNNMEEKNVLEKLNTLSIPAAILLGCIILGGFYYFSQVSKQNSIEEQQAREFISGQKKSCLAIYEQESSKWNNVSGWRYDDINDDCYVEYKSNPKPTIAECDAKYKGEDGEVFSWAIMDWILCQDGLFEKSF